MSNSASNTETFRSPSLGQVNITSFDAMQEIAIHESGGHRRPATLPLEPSSSSLHHSNEIINSSSIISAQLPMVKNTPIDALKEWSVSTYKCTKQMLNERLGKCTKTIDLELEAQVERLRETQLKYTVILQQARQMCSQYSTIITLQSAMYEQFNELALRETKTSMSTTENYERHSGLSADFKQNSEMMRSISKNGEKLILALKFFISNLSTLIYKTIEDTMITIRAMESARIEFDAERNSLNNFLSGNAPTGNGTSSTPGNSATPVTTVTSEKMNIAKAKYERLREDVTVKMDFLEENKSKVMHKQLVLFHNAFAAFASGNAQALDSTLKQFSIRSQSMSFLEK